MSLLWKKRRNHYSAGRGGLSHCWSCTKTLALFVFVMRSCSKSPVEVYVTLRTVSMFPAWRKWGPRTGKVTNHFPAFCFRPGPYHTVPVLGFFSPVFMWELLQDFTCWHHFSSPHPLSPILIFPDTSCSWSIHLRRRLESWRRRWCRPRQQLTRSSWTRRGETHLPLLLSSLLDSQTFQSNYLF